MDRSAQTIPVVAPVDPHHRKSETELKQSIPQRGQHPCFRIDYGRQRQSDHVPHRHVHHDQCENDRFPQPTAQIPVAHLIRIFPRCAIVYGCAVSRTIHSSADRLVVCFRGIVSDRHAVRHQTDCNVLHAVHLPYRSVHCRRASRTAHPANHIFLCRHTIPLFVFWISRNMSI